MSGQLTPKTPELVCYKRTCSLRGTKGPEVKCPACGIRRTEVCRTPDADDETTLDKELAQRLSEARIALSRALRAQEDARNAACAARAEIRRLQIFARVK